VASEFHKLRVKNLVTGDVEELYEEQVRIEIDGDGLVSIMTPSLGGREFLLTGEALEQARKDALL